MQIYSVSVEGFRCLADVARVPVLSQTILTGQNEGGKTALLDALNFLLHGTALSEHDLTYVGDGDSQEPGGDTGAPHARMPQTVVTGSFSLSAEEQLHLELPEQVRIRRRFRPEAGMFLEIHRRVCHDPQLRDLAAVKLPGLKELAAVHGVEPVGQANARNSWEQPLRALAQQLKQVDAWVSAASEVAAALPTMVYFKGDSVQAPEAVIQSLLNSRLREYTRADEVAKRVTDLEGYLAESLKEDIRAAIRPVPQRPRPRRRLRRRQRQPHQPKARLPRRQAQGARLQPRTGVPLPRLPQRARRPVHRRRLGRDSQRTVEAERRTRPLAAPGDRSAAGRQVQLATAEPAQGRLPRRTEKQGRPHGRHRRAPRAGPHPRRPVRSIRRPRQSRAGRGAASLVAAPA